MASDKALRARFFLGLLISAGILTLLILGPFILTLLVAAAFATVFHPMYRWLLIRLRFQWLASAVTVLIAAIMLLLPLSWIITEISFSASRLYAELARGDVSIEFLKPIESSLSRAFPTALPTLESMLADIFGWIASNAGSLFTGTVNTVIRLFIGVFAFYIFLRDGQRFVEWTIRTIPLPASDSRTLLRRMKSTILSIIQGNLVVCVAQGVVTGVLMAIVGVPNPVLWATLTVIVAIAPGIGPSAVILPASFYLFSSGHEVSAVVFMVLNMGSVWFIANIVGPVLVSQGVKIHEIWIVASVIGGIVTMGPLGFIVGPLALSIFSSLIDMTPHVLRE